MLIINCLLVEPRELSTSSGFSSSPKNVLLIFLICYLSLFSHKTHTQGRIWHRDPS